MKKFTKEVRIGIAAIIGLALAIFGFNWLKGTNLLEPKTFYYITFSNIGGLSKSSAVFADGVKIGNVRDIKYRQSEEDNIVVQIEVSDDIRIPKGSTAELVSEIMGGMHIDILMANNPREKVMVGDTLKGELNKGLMANVARIAPKIEQLVPKVDSILVGVNSIFRNEKLQKSMENLERTTANLADITQAIKGLMNSEVKEIAKNINVASNNFAYVSGELKNIDYNKMLDQIDQTVATTKNLVNKLNSTEGTIGLLLNDATLYNNLNQASENAASLLKDLQTNPKRYVHFSIWGRKNNK